MTRRKKGRRRLPTLPSEMDTSPSPSLPSSQLQSPPPTPPPSPPPDFGRYEPYDFGTSNSMEAAIYRAAIAGDIDGLTTALQQNSQLNLLDQLTPQDDTILHIAARLGHDHLVEPIQSSCPDLFKSKNCNDDHPLHLAAAGGHLSIVRSLITNALRFAISSGREETEAEQDILDVIKGQNKQGNTPLHMAVKDHQYDVALFLFTWARNLLTSCVPNLEEKLPLYTAAEGSLLTSCVLNLEQKSPLYLAAEAGHQELFELMIQFVASNVVAQNMLKDGQPLLHVAITRRNMGYVASSYSFGGYEKL